MKASFVFSSRAYKYKGKYYTVNLTPSTLHKLYFPYCDQLVMCLREKCVDHVDGLTYAEDKDISYQCAKIDASIVFYLLKRPLLEKTIKKVVRESDYVIARMGLSGVIAAKYARKLHKPYVCEVVGPAYQNLFFHSRIGKIAAPYIEKMVKREIRKAKYVCYVTEKTLQKQYPTNGYSVGISDVEILDYHPVNLENRINKIKNYRPDERLKLVTLGPVDKAMKGQMYVIQAIAELKKENYIFEYHLVGGGNPEKLIDLAKRLGVEAQLVFAGTVNHEKVFEYLKDMDVYIQPSLTEGLPRALIEAMSIALPCAGSNVDGIPELLEREMVFEPKDVQGIMRVLKSLDRGTMLRNAEFGFRKAFYFTEDEASRRRKEFWENFIKDNFTKASEEQ